MRFAATREIYPALRRTWNSAGATTRWETSIGWHRRAVVAALKAVDYPLSVLYPQGTQLASLRAELVGIDAPRLAAMEEHYGARNYHPLDIIIMRAKGVWVWDELGRRYLDCLSSYSAINFGHGHPRIVKALKRQAERVAVTSRAFRNDQLPYLEKELCELTGLDLMLPMNSGAEAVETAIKAARKWGYQKKRIPPDQAEIITCENNFHGRTVTIVGFSTELLYRRDFGPFTPGFVTVPFGNLEALKGAIGPKTAAFLVEPIQAEAGIVIPPNDYLREAKRICQERDVLFMADEIQTGLGRTGRLFACDHEAVKPDVLVIGKSLGGGVLPISAVLAPREVLGLFQPGEHGSTFGGNPLACAVARESLRVLRDERMVENAAQLGEYFLGKLATIQSRHIKEVRGRGLLIGMELKPEAGGARRFCEALKEEGILCKETHEHVIRFAPPLIITREELDWAFERIKQVLEA